MKIKVIASKPALGQEPIEALIGQVFNATPGYHDGDKRRPDGTMEVFDDVHFKGAIVLQKGEYEIFQG